MANRGLRVIINHWGPQFTALYGHIFPESYLCVDTEYTGGNEAKDLIVEIGHTLVENRQVVDQFSVVLDWSNHPIVPDHWVRLALRRIELKMAESNRPWRVTYEVMKDEGIKPEKALQFYYQLFQTIKQRKLLFAAHHGYFADERMLRGHFEGFLGKTFRFGENDLFDTGAIEKASVCLDSPDPEVVKKRKLFLPREGDTLEKYFRRVVGARIKGVYWNLQHCAKKYNIHEKFGLDANNHHTAGFDSLVVHYLMEEFRSRVFRSNAGESGLESPAAFQRMFEQEMAKGRDTREAKERMDRARAEFEDQGKPIRRPVRRRGQRMV